MGICGHVSGNTFKSQLHSATSSQEVAEIPGYPTRCYRDNWGLPGWCKGRGENQKGFWRMWLLGCSGRAWFTGWSLGDGYLQLWSGFVLICSTRLPCPPVGAAWLLHSSHQGVRNHQNHSAGCKKGAANTLTALRCRAAPICSPPRAPEAVLLTNDPCWCEVLWYKAVGGNGCSRGGRSARCSQPSSPFAGHAATTSNLILSCSSSWPPLKNSFSFTWQSRRHVGALPAAELNALSSWVWNNCSG